MFNRLNGIFFTSGPSGPIPTIPFSCASFWGHTHSGPFPFVPVVLAMVTPGTGRAGTLKADGSAEGAGLQLGYGWIWWPSWGWFLCWSTTIYSSTFRMKQRIYRSSRSHSLTHGYSGIEEWNRGDIYPMSLPGWNIYNIYIIYNIIYI